MGTAPSRTAAAVATVIAMLVVGGVGMAYELFALAFGTCSGDGGSPYAAPDSAQGHVCSFLDGGGTMLVTAIEIGVLVAAALAVAAWARRHIRTGVVVGATVVAAMLPFAGLSALAAPSDDCSKADQATWQHWVDQLEQPSHTDRPPVDCENY